MVGALLLAAFLSPPRVVAGAAFSAAAALPRGLAFAFGFACREFAGATAFPGCRPKLGTCGAGCGTRWANASSDVTNIARETPAAITHRRNWLDRLMMKLLSGKLTC